MMSDETPLTPEVLVPRIGDYLVEKGIITTDDLENALALQKQMRLTNKSAFLGQVLIDMKVIDRTTLDKAVTEQALALRAALLDSNAQLERRVQQRTAELEQALHKLSELSDLKANFIANVSHELRTPLTHLKGYLELLAGGDLGIVNEDQLQALEVMQRASERLEHLIDDLILFSTSEQNELELRFEPFQMQTLFNQIVNSSHQKAADRQVELAVDCAESLPAIMADPEKINWVLSQLVDNAIKFTPSGGRVTLQALQNDNFARISILDTGIGIPEDRLAEIFEPFHQLDSSSTRRYGGTGLGLALVKKIIEAHGAVINVQSEEGHGSTFEFILPYSSL
jgi:signal transduction histidine kinase